MGSIAVIVESRDLPNLDLIISNHMEYLPGWEVDIVSDQVIQNPFWDYNKILTSVDFWKKYKDHERVLIFQHDSMILRCCIDEFMEYDYVGAPWKADGSMPWARPDRKGGNGGFSLRNPRVMIKTVQAFPWHPNRGNEDCHFVHNIDKIGGAVAPYGACKKFSVESEFSLGSFGLHQIESHLSTVQCEQIRNQYAAVA